MAGGEEEEEEEEGKKENNRTSDRKTRDTSETRGIAFWTTTP
jgi:hypothetical protein